VRVRVCWVCWAPHLSDFSCNIGKQIYKQFKIIHHNMSEITCNIERKKKAYNTYLKGASEETSASMFAFPGEQATRMLTMAAEQQ
jgi:hypothetical protein